MIIKIRPINKRIKTKRKKKKTKSTKKPKIVINATNKKKQRNRKI